MMRRLNRWKFITVIVLLAGGSFLYGCQRKQAGGQQETAAYYTCPMHHQIHEDKPGYCPICGMKLIRVSPGVSADKIPLDSALSYLAKPVTETVVGSFKVIEPVMSQLDDTLTADGYIGFDQRDVNSVNTRVAGRIEKLYVTYVNQRIHKGQPLMKIYSPELVSAQRNLLQALQEKDQELIQPLKEQLLNLGMQASEIKEVMQSGKPLSAITIYSPYNGIFRPMSADNSMDSRSSSPNRTASQTGMETEAGNMSSTGRDVAGQSAGEPEALNVREGMYVNRGQTVFSIQNTDRIWAILHVFNGEVDHIHPGDGVILYRDADPANTVKGHIDFIPPYRAQDEKTTSVRIYLKRLPQDWKINGLIHGKIPVNGGNKEMYVPLSAVNRLGIQNVVWLQDKDHPHVFHARTVETGIETTDSIQIISGLRKGDKIAENAAYMVDSDSFIH